MDLTNSSNARPSEPRFSRTAAERGFERVLHRGGWGNPDVLLVEVDGTRFVVKDYAPRRLIVRALIGRFLLRREVRAYERLAALDHVPLCLGWVDRDAIVIEYRPGVLLSRSLAGRLPRGFMGELETCVAAMHQKGVVHLDLRHRSNILADEKGHPVVLDFASALCFDPSRAAGRLGRRLCAWIDWRAIEKWRVRLVTPESERPEGDPKTASGGG